MLFTTVRLLTTYLLFLARSKFYGYMTIQILMRFYKAMHQNII